MTARGTFGGICALNATIVAGMPTGMSVEVRRDASPEQRPLQSVKTL